MDSITKNQISIIVFSKGRSLQLHAYLESLFLFSDATQKMVTVLYSETANIRYEKLIQCFPQVTWIKEEQFEKDLKRLITDAGEYIMFGCDDVVFTGKFCLTEAAFYLMNNPKVFGYSMRLGDNIVPRPQNLSAQEGVFAWKWNCEYQHYNYPWELDCTLYRKEDVFKLTIEEENAIKNPNYYEAMLTPDNREKRIARPHMACNAGISCAIVITVNRVQDTHQNGFDDSMLTDIYSLDRLYNDEDNTLDIEKIATMGNHVIHVGAEYFILRKKAKGYSAARLYKKKAKEITGKLTRLPIRVDRHLERLRYEKGAYADKLSILTTGETMRLLEKEKVSFLRYGDGEIAIMMGNSIPFQEFNPKLARRLRKILRTETEGLKIGIPYYYTHPIKNLNPFVASFARSLTTQRRFLCRNCDRDIVYIDTCITQAYQTYEKYNFQQYYKHMQNLLKGQEITLICGEGVLDKLEYKAYSVCASVDFIMAPSINAFDKYDMILRRALRKDKKKLVCIVLGPTAKVLVWDLHKRGYQAWDMGHYFKDYDAYMKKKPQTEAEIVQFYKPD